MDLSVVIVSYNTKDLLKDCLESVFSGTSLDSIRLEVFVVDNNSSDGSYDMVRNKFPQVRLIGSKANLGYAKANNEAIRQSSGRYVLLLNPDTIISPETFVTMIRFMDAHSNVGVAGCKVVRPDGTLDLACRRSFHSPMVSVYRVLRLNKLFPNSRRFGAYNLTYLNENESYEVDSVAGSFMMIRRETFEQVGLLDENFFMYVEDVDFCYRAKQAGWRIYYYPETKIIHYKGESSQKQSSQMIREFNKSMRLFFNKYYIPQYGILRRCLVHLGLRCQLAVALLRNSLRREKKVVI